MRFERWAVLWLFVWTAVPAAFAQDEQAKSIVYRDAIVVRETLETIMARPEFRRLAEKPEAEASGENPSWLERFFEWLEELLASEPEAEARATRSFAGVNYLVYALAAALLIVVLAFIFKTVVSTHRQKSLPPEDARALIVQAGAAPGETPPEQYWARAETLEAQKDYKGAIRELLLGAMSATERRGLIRHRRSLTNRDYIWAARGAMRESLITIVAAFELVYFGRRGATAESYLACARAYGKSFGGSRGVLEAME